MFIGGGVEHGLGTKSFEGMTEQIIITNVTQNRMIGYFRIESL
jgi:hypothetical protein